MEKLGTYRDAQGKVIDPNTYDFEVAVMRFLHTLLFGEKHEK